jgi:hypothetical protein
MRFFGIYRTQLTRPPFADAEAVALGVWVRVHSYASQDGHESPVIRACRQWSQRTWLTTCQSSLEELETAVSAGLCAWKGNDLLVVGYDLEGQRRFEQKRINASKPAGPGRKRGRPSTKKPPGRIENPNGKPNAKPTENPSPPLSDPSVSDPSLAIPETETEGSPPGPSRVSGASEALTGRQLLTWFGEERTQTLGGLPWHSPGDPGGKASYFATQVEPALLPEIRPTMRRMFENIKKRRPGWTDERLVKTPAFAFGSWMSRFTELLEDMRGCAPVVAPKERPLIRSETICFSHREMPDKPASESDPLCRICQRLGDRKRRPWPPPENHLDCRGGRT